MIKFKIDPKKVGLLVHDMQNIFLREDCKFSSAEGRSIIPKTKKLIDTCRAKGIPIIYTKAEMRKDFLDWGLIKEVFPPEDLLHFTEGSEEVEIYNEIAPQEGDIIIRKTAYSAFYNTNLENILGNLSIDTLAITGVDTNIGCDSATRDAFYRGIKVIFLTDATATHGVPDVGWGAIPPNEAHKVSCSILGYCFAELTTTDEFIKRLG